MCQGEGVYVSLRSASPPPSEYRKLPAADVCRDYQYRHQHSHFARGFSSLMPDDAFYDNYRAQIPVGEAV